MCQKSKIKFIEKNIGAEAQNMNMVSFQKPDKKTSFNGAPHLRIGV